MGELSEKDVNDVAKALAWAPLGYMLGIPVVTFYFWSAAYAIEKIWSWHLLPLGLPQISMEQFFAALLICGIATNGMPRPKPVDSRTMKEKAVGYLSAFALPWVMLIIAWWMRP